MGLICILFYDIMRETDAIPICKNICRMKQTLKTIVSFLLNPRLLLCLGIAWMITNGWSYVLMALGTRLRIDWMIAVSGAYLAFLWLPVSPEKLVTFAIAIALLRLWFPNDTKTLAILHRWHSRAQNAVRRKREKQHEKTHSEDENEP